METYVTKSRFRIQSEAQKREVAQKNMRAFLKLLWVSSPACAWLVGTYLGYVSVIF